MRILEFRTLVLLVALGVFASGCGSATIDEDAVGAENSENSADGSKSVPAGLSIVDTEAAGYDIETNNLTAGGKTTLAEFVDGDKPVLVWSWAPHCGICRGEAPVIDAFAKENADDVQVIGVGATDSLSLAEDFVASTGVNSHTMTWAEKQNIWFKNGFKSFPQAKVVCGDLSYESEVLSGFDEDKVLAAIEACGQVK